MRKLIAIGEALIDFIPEQKGRALKDVTSFEKHAGGAPANVAAGYARLGGNAYVLTKLGLDAFGEFLIENMKKEGIATDYVLRTGEANTSLAFVALDSNGDRSFSFYRKPGSDMLIDKSELKKDWFSDCILHFCSVDLIECPTKHAHDAAISYTKERGGIVSFDVNLRFSLWDDHAVLKSTVLEYATKCDIIKISEEEAEFLADTTDREEVAQFFLNLGAKIVFITLGDKGAEAYCNGASAKTAGFYEKAIDTTGAGDIFISTALFVLEKKKIPLDNITEKDLLSVINSACKASSLSVKVKGATFDEKSFFQTFPDLN